MTHADLVATPVFDALLAESAPAWLVEHFAPKTPEQEVADASPELARQ